MTGKSVGNCVPEFRKFNSKIQWRSLFFLGGGGVRGQANAEGTRPSRGGGSGAMHPRENLESLKCDFEAFEGELL